ncbi:SnoRNA binding domain containing protein [Trichomonas vaginalis G3]|uniref:SnoRNA binding domain containing protein n=1 Tax=Trichomonas vaginalis (strain ATCC PRA-98 / G3) TaxID=412133 RepID=A2DW58_TRIV3|nr:spliceosomal tri-snRNP complex assembly [Trichomonas vaginalis G3]EAY15359.1 SnoRNA binding domain containing protein [Trichomonas vaginalis G3]KAI5496775.1 spliceosomal tri-snRNP complex assembly [Trichomonas vaginalis G3]|eukprot:XP_001327582.1 SnoRNA binding domain containing protein [Trichomonas vaginalis G3]
MNLDHLQEVIQEYTKAPPTSIDGSMVTLTYASTLLKLRKQLHSILTNTFHERFADLASVVTDYKPYAILAKHLATHNEIESEDIRKFLTSQQIVACTLSLQQQLGPEIESKDFQEACDLQIAASDVSTQLSEICTKCVEMFAPNMCALVGPEISAILITHAGGLKQLSQIPSCNIKTFGSNKSALLGFSSRNIGNHQGIIYTSELVQQTDPEYRDSIFRNLADKVALCCRVDASKGNPDGSFGEKSLFEIKEKLDKKINNFTPKYVRPIPPPEIVSKKTRGGRQARARKKKFGLNEELEKRQKVAFGVGGQFGEQGEVYGVAAFQKLVKEKPKTDEPFQKMIEKKLKQLDEKRK